MSVILKFLGSERSMLSASYIFPTFGNCRPSLCSFTVCYIFIDNLRVIIDCICKSSVLILHNINVVDEK